MNLTLRSLIIILIFPSLNAEVHEFNMKTWNLSSKKYGFRTIDENFKEYCETRTNLLHVRLQLEYSIRWKKSVIEYVTEILKNSTRMAFVINVQNMDSSVNSFLYYYNIWYVDSYRAFERILPDLQKNRGNYPDYYFIMVRLTYGKRNYLQVVEKMLKKMYFLNIVHVNVVVLNSPKPLALYSYDTFQAESCRNVTIKQVNQFINGSFSNPELFPQKLKDFNECRIYFLSRNVAPFFTFNASDESKRIAVGGIEGKMITTMANYLNFTPVLTIAPSHTWGDVYLNGSVTGPYGLLEDRRVDVLMGYYTYEPRRLRHFGASFPYIFSPMVVVVKLRKEIIRISATWLLDPLTYEAWLCILSLIGMAIILNKLTEMLIKRKCLNWVEILGIVLGVTSSTVDSFKSFLRYCIISLYIGFMICTTAYQGQLYVAYNYVETTRPMSLTDLKSGNFTFIVRYTFEMNHLLEHDLKVDKERIKRIFSNRDNGVYETLMRAEGRAAILTTKLRIMHYMIDRGYYYQLHVLDEAVHMNQVCAYFQPHSFLIQPFNRMISLLRGCGLISKWYNDAEEKLVKQQAQLLNVMYGDGHQKALSLQVFQPVFIVWAWCLFVGTLVFLFEMWWKPMP